MSSEAATLVARDMLDFWRSLEADGVLRCPVCTARLRVAQRAFTCSSCLAIYPVNDGVPLLMRPDEVISVADRVIDVFNLPRDCKERIETALTTLIKYRSHSHPEFANFFARFDAREGLVHTIPLSIEDSAAAISKVECVTPYFPKTLRVDQPEFRSIRIKNGSDKVLFTDDRNRLYLSYRLFTPGGDPVVFASERSALPCPLRPGDEMTVPVRIRLPETPGVSFVVRFHFVLVVPRVKDAKPAGGNRQSRWSMLRGILTRLANGKTAEPQFEAETTHWFDTTALAEMRVTALANAAEFPAVRQGDPAEFDVHKDVALGDEFLAGIIRDVRSKGVSKPRILEIGAGVHSVALRTCDENSTVIVSDISLVMEQIASIMHSENPAVTSGRAAFACFDMMHPPFQNGSFDIVCICAAFHHLPMPGEFLKRLAPLMSPEGRFVALREPCVVNPFEPTYIMELANGFNEQMFELPEWQAILAHGGFEIDRAVIDFGYSLKFSARLS